MSPSILITGASTGIGYAAVRRFTSAGYSVAATVRRKQDEERLLQEFPQLELLNLDLNDSSAIEKMIGGYLAKKGGVDVVVNNAGFAQIGVVEELTIDQWRRQMETNFFAVIHITRLALPYMREKANGRIIQIGSGFGKSVSPVFGPYCASKHALEAFTEALRYEVGSFGVGVSLIAPGPVTSNFDANRQKPDETAIEASPYRKVLRAVQGRVNKAHQKETPAEGVVDKIWEAATCSNPKLRYPVGPLGYAAGWSALIPNRLLERAMGGKA